jgi:anti-sigma factor RsiW
MTCKEVIDFLLEYQSGELPDTQRSEFDRHLAACPSCVDYMRSYELTIRAGKLAYQPSDDELGEVPAELVKAILAARSKRT